MIARARSPPPWQPFSPALVLMDSRSCQQVNTEVQVAGCCPILQNYGLNSGGSSVADPYWGRQVNTGVRGKGLGVQQRQRRRWRDGKESGDWLAGRQNLVLLSDFGWL